VTVLAVVRQQDSHVPRWTVIEKWAVAETGYMFGSGQGSSFVLVSRLEINTTRLKSISSGPYIFTQIAK
jgi:hypothetical protein